MTKEQKMGYLKKLAYSTEGEALTQHFQELIDELTDSRSYPVDDFEMEGRASVKAAKVLGKIIKDLKLLKRETKSREANQYQ